MRTLKPLSRRSWGRGPYFVEAVGKAIDIVWAFHNQSKGLTIEEVVAITNIAKSTTYRLLCTLVEAGILTLDQERERYLLSPRFFNLAASAQPDLRTVAEPEMIRLWNTVEETTNLGILEGREVLYLAKIASPHPFRLEVSEGTRAPIHSTALGKAMAAFLPRERVGAIIREEGLKKYTPNTITNERRFWKELDETRARGYALDNEEMHVGGRCIARPIFDAENQVIGAISVSAPLFRMKIPPTKAILDALKLAADRISAQFGWTAESVSFSHPTEE
ncbi:MAG TPA: IclR family transcriptional regulator [Acidobacteriota bacterium]|nr:IclR family transcriptional regulator [Acidobacteriota bacterium]